MSSSRRTDVFGWCALVLSVLASSCHVMSWAPVAERASLGELRNTVHQRQLQGEIGRDDVRELAIAVARREIYSAVDPDGEELLQHLVGCIPSVADPLWNRSRRSDHTAGVALLKLVESGKKLDSAEWAAATTSVIGARRAAAALASNSRERWLVREQLLNDGDPEVRRAALSSCRESPAPLHFDTLTAIMRADPDPSCRELAARDIGVIGGEPADTFLSDAFNSADTGLRLSIVSAWTQAATFRAGGERRLVAVAREEPGVVGALAGANLALGSSSSKAVGLARVARSLEFGSGVDLELAIRAAAWDDAGHATSLLRLGLGAEAPLRVAALERWLEIPRHRWPALTSLRQLAEKDDAAAVVARSVLAHHAEGSVNLALRRQLAYANWQSRARAGRDLWLLGDYAGVCSALADDAPEVRIVTACAVLAQPPASRAD